MSRIDILDLFDRYGILPTPQRGEVAEVLLVRPQHMSAEQIIDRLHQLGSSVSKATVYNTLNLFGERGIVKEVMADPNLLEFHFPDVKETQLANGLRLLIVEKDDLPKGTRTLRRRCWSNRPRAHQADLRLST